MTVFFLYGSANGTAQSISHMLYTEALTRGIASKYKVLNDVVSENLLDQISIAVIVCSTTGDGDAPDNAAKFFRHLKQISRKNDPSLPDSRPFQSWKYALLALGDTNYDKFCNAGKTLDQLLLQIGAKKFKTRGEADDAVGLDQVVDPWCKSLWPALSEAIAATPSFTRTDSGAVNDSRQLARTDAEGREAEGKEQAGRGEMVAQSVDQKTVLASGHEWLTRCADTDFVWLNLADARQLTSPDAVRQVWDMRLSFPDASSLESNGDDRAKYDRLWSRLAVGDALAIRVPNRGNDVDATLRICDCAGDVVVRHSEKLPPYVQTPCFAEDCLTYMVSLDVVTPSLLRYLAECTDIQSTKTRLETLASAEGLEEFQCEIVEKKLTVAETIRTLCPSCKPTLEGLLPHLSRFKPRYYSLANDPFASLLEHSSSHTSVDDCFADGVRTKTDSSSSTEDLHSCLSALLLNVPNATFSRASVEVVFSVAESRESEERSFRGLATSYFESQISSLCGSALRSAIRVACSVVPSHEFRLPCLVGASAPPMILVAAGTGIAPFRAFLRRRQGMVHAWRRKLDSQLVLSPWWLFFGCRQIEKDHLVRSEIPTWLSSGCLSRSSCAFSQDPQIQSMRNGGKYIQDHLWEHRVEIRKWLLEHNAWMMVCGDAQGMVRDVHETLVQCLTSTDPSSAEPWTELRAREFLEMLKSEKRYQRESWAS
eukprot:ANDGO_02587.mRNA.1 Putative methionine synthase reductase